MARLRQGTLALIASAAALLAIATPSQAVVGGSDAPAGSYGSVARITFGGAFLCTGTLIAPEWVLTAGHCGSLTGAILATPIAFPPAAIDVRIGSNKLPGGQRVAVRHTLVDPSYLLTSGSDITLLQLAAPAAQTPTPIAGTGQRALWNPGVSQTIAGWGTTSQDGPTPDTLQQTEVPIVADLTCAATYPGSFETDTQLCAGLPQGGRDACQGDSGGPLFGRLPAGDLRVVGSTSYGEGCAQAGKPGVYARVADTQLREWIRSVAPDAIDNGPIPAAPETGAVEEPQLRLTLSPRHVRSGRRTTVRFLVRDASGDRVEGALVRFGGRGSRTGSGGRVTMRVKAHKRGLRKVIVTKPGSVRTVRHIRIVR